MSSTCLKLNGIDLTQLSDLQLKQLCLKYQIATTSEVRSTKQQLLNEVKSFLTHKTNKYKGRRKSQPNVMAIESSNDPPKAMEAYTRDRRMSQPITSNEVRVAKENHVVREKNRTRKTRS